jgi:hypothetical protein
MRLAAAFLALASIPCLADDLGDRLHAARQQLASEDVAERNRGEADLLAVAAEAGSKLEQLLRDPDAEVRCRVSEMLEREGIIPEDGKTARLRTLLSFFAVPEKPGQDRASSVREALRLHPNAARLVSRELREGRLSLLPDAPAVLAPGRFTFSAVVVNNGPCAAWIRPSRFSLVPDYRAFGDRWRSARCGGCLSAESLIEDEETPEDAVVRNLAELVRVPAGSRFTLATYDEHCGCCGILQLRLRTNVYIRQFDVDGEIEADFSGVTITLPEASPELGWLSPRVILGEMRGKTARAATFADEKGRGLDITALEDLPALPVVVRDPYWWAALDANGVFLGSGAFGTEEADLAALPKGETRRIRLRVEPPAGTVTLWMGFTRNGEECVPAPVTLK